MADKEKINVEELTTDGKRHIAYGFGIGVISIGAVATLGAIACPLCVVAAPGFILSGAFKLRKAKDIEDLKKQAY